MRYDRVGRRYGHLVVLTDTGQNDKGGKSLWLCRCDCGKETIKASGNLTSGNTRSCGLCSREPLPLGLDKQGRAVLRLFKSYQFAARGRGREWWLSIDEFRALVLDDCFYCGSPPSRLHANFLFNGIDRIDNDWDYTPQNTRTCCKRCNMAKGRQSEADFINMTRDIAHHLNL